MVNQPKSVQNLEKLVDVLEERRDEAISSGQKRFIVAIIGGTLSAFLVGLGAYTDSQLAKILYTSVGGLAGISALMVGAQSVLDFYRNDLLNDKIAELKQSPEYKAQENSDQKSQ